MAIDIIYLDFQKVFLLYMPTPKFAAKLAFMHGDVLK